MSRYHFVATMIRNVFPSAIKRGLLIGGMLVAGVARGELKLVAKLDGASFTIQDIGAGRLLGTDGQRTYRVPYDVELTIEGNLAADTRLVWWDPYFAITHPPLRERLSVARRPWFGQVRVNNGWTGANFGQVWPAFIREPALIVFGWVARGKFTHVRVRPLPDVPDRENFSFNQTFQLSETEAMQGQGVLLIWSKGKFIAPRAEFKDREAQTAFGAIMVDDIAALNAALARKPNLKTGGGDLTSLLEFAAVRGSVDTVRALLPQGSKPDQRLRGALLMLAANFGRMALVEYLLWEKTPLDRVSLSTVLRFGNDAVAMRLLAHDPKAFPNDRKALQRALASGFAEIAAELIARGATHDFSSAATARLLLEQTKLGHTKMVQFLLSRGANPNALVDGRTPLLVAAAARDEALLDVLLRSGAKTSIVDRDGATPLLLACAVNDLTGARILITAGADAKMTRKDGSTCLHFAALHNNLDLISLLLEQGADLHAIGARNQRALEVALLAGSDAAARGLGARGARCNLQGEDGDQLIEAALKFDVVEVVRDALAAGWTAENKINGRWPANWVAGTHGAKRVVELLGGANSAGFGIVTPEVVPAAHLDSPLKVRHVPPVADPRAATLRFRRQIVQVRCLIDEEGRIGCPRIYASDDGWLNLIALQSVRGWRFNAPLKAGQPVCAEAVVPVIFEAKPEAVPNSEYIDAPAVSVREIEAYIPEFIRMELTSQILRSRLPLDGDVRMKVVVQADGSARLDNVVDAFDRDNASAAALTLNKWTFSPGVVDGVAATTLLDLTMN